MFRHISTDNEHPDADGRSGAHAQSGGSGKVINDRRSFPVHSHLLDSSWFILGGEALVSDFEYISAAVEYGVLDQQLFFYILQTVTHIHKPGNPLTSHMVSMPVIEDTFHDLQYLQF